VAVNGEFMQLKKDWELILEVQKKERDLVKFTGKLLKNA